MNGLIVFMLLGSLLPLAYANDSGNNIDNEFLDETQQQIEIMNNGIGAKIRLLQLEKAIMINIEKGQSILTFLADSALNVTALEAILYELTMVKGEVQSADANATDAVQIFVDLKHDAINLTKEFRETLRGLLNTLSLEQLQIRLQNMSRNHTQELTQPIQQNIRRYNVHRFRYYLNLTEENENGLLSQYQNGSITMRELKQNITKQINHSKKEIQFHLISSMKQENIRNKIRAEQRIQNASEGFQHRLQERLETRLMRFETLTNHPLQQELMNRIQNKLNNMGNTDTPENQGSGENGPNDQGRNDDAGNGNAGGGTSGQGSDNGKEGSNSLGSGGGSG